jgi:hypothetical protein
MRKTLRGDGRFARRSRQRRQGRRRAKRRRRGGAPGGAPPSASPSAAGEMRRGDAAPEAQKAATPTAWRGIYPAPPGAPLPSLSGSSSVLAHPFLPNGHSPAASTKLGRARAARTIALSAPAKRGRGTTGARAASEPWWRGRRTRRFVAVAENSYCKKKRVDMIGHHLDSCGALSPAPPPPPCCAGTADASRRRSLRKYGGRRPPMPLPRSPAIAGADDAPRTQ